ncbi:MAG: hypothetical protein GY874_23290 [Desulfobacteraceae bacterium]|nr:hypothetical protein [Desulfobacteraceae bacterium]
MFKSTPTIVEQCREYEQLFDKALSSRFGKISKVHKSGKRPCSGALLGLFGFDEFAASKKLGFTVAGLVH